MRKWLQEDGAIVGGDFFLSARGEKKIAQSTLTDNTPGSTRAGMIGQRPVTWYISHMCTRLSQVFSGPKSQRIEIMVIMLW